MDFRTCPACHASVLEDDAQDCPFCGASMSGKPQAAKPRPAPTAPAKPSSAPAAPAAKAPEQKPAAPRSRNTAAARAAARENAEDPFEVDTSATLRAVKLAPRPTKTRTHEVVCPMCETPGYLAPQDAGKDVRCCNAECMAPVFKSPRIKVVEAPKEEPKKMSPALIASMAIGGLAILGGGAYFALRPAAKVHVVDDGPLEDNTQERLKGLVPEKNTVVQRKSAAPSTPAEFRNQSLTLLEEKIRLRDRNRNQAYGIQLAAEGYADAGALQQAQSQVDRLRSTSRSATYLLVPPLVEIGWKQLKMNQNDQAQKTATDALEQAKNLPRSVRKTHDAAVALASLLAALNRLDEAESLIRTESDLGPRGQVSAMWQGAMESGTFDIDLEAARPWRLASPSPMRQAVIETLVSRGRVDRALEFAEAAKSEDVRDAGLAAWAGRLASQKKAAAIENMNAVAQSGGFSPTAKCRAWAAMAAVFHSQNDTASAQTALDQAVALLDQIKAPDAASMPTKRQIYESEGRTNAGLRNPAPMRSLALAAADVGTVQARMGQREAAWTSFQKSLQATRGMTPSPVATTAAVDECLKQDALVRRALDSQLGLGGDQDKVRLAFIRYRNQCRKLDEESQARFVLQGELLSAAAREGLLAETWAAAQKASQETEANLKEPYLDTKLAGYLQGLATVTRDQGVLGQIGAAFSNRTAKQDQIEMLETALNWEVAEGRLQQAREAIERLYRSDMAKQEADRSDLLALRLASRVQRDRDPAEALQFIKGLYDPVVKEDACLMLSAHAVSKGAGASLWRTVADQRDLMVLELASLYRGFIAGLPDESTNNSTADAAKT